MSEKPIAHKDYIEQQAEAWLACCTALEEATPGFMQNTGTGKQCAVTAIQALAAKVAATERALPEIAEALGDETLTNVSQVATGIRDLRERLTTEAAPAVLPEPLKFAIDRFDAYFRSANGVPPNARISVPTSEWQALRALLATGGQAQANSVIDFPHEEVDALAITRYKVVAADKSMFWESAVVAGDGTRQLYTGRKVECENMARKFAGAFAEGAFVFHAMHAPQAQAMSEWKAEQKANAESDYQRGYRHGYNRRDAEVQGALV